MTNLAPDVTVFTLIETVDNERGYDHLKLEVKNGEKPPYRVINLFL